MTTSFTVETIEPQPAAVVRAEVSMGHELGPAMWESYLSDPGAQPDPATWETRIAWLIL